MSNFCFRSQFTIKGIVSIYREVGESRELIGRFSNVVTTAYKNRLLNRMLSSADTSDIVVTKMAWGTGVNPATVSDINLQIPILEKALNNNPSISASGTVYEGRLELTEGNTTLTELALKTSDNLLVARVNISVAKTGVDIFIFNWTHTLIGA